MGERVIDDPGFLPFSTNDLRSTDRDTWWLNLCDEYILDSNFSNSVGIDEYIKTELNAELVTSLNEKLFTGIMFKTENDKLLFLLKYS